MCQQLLNILCQWCNILLSEMIAYLVLRYSLCQFISLIGYITYSELCQWFVLLKLTTLCGQHCWRNSATFWQSKLGCLTHDSSHVDNIELENLLVLEWCLQIKFKPISCTVYASVSASIYLSFENKGNYIPG